MNGLIRQAAQERCRGVRAPGDRPSSRRCERSASSRGWTPAHLARIEVRGTLADPGAPLVFDGFASVTDRGYEMWDAFGPYMEYVHIGAFTETLSGAPDVPLVLDHVSSRRIARTGNTNSPLILSEVTQGDTTGLHVLAPSLDRMDPDTAYVVPKLQSGLLDEMSFRFMITSGRWSEDWTEYHIHSVDINRGDVSIVGYGANPHTAGSGLRSGTLTIADRALLALSAERDIYRAR